MHTQTTQNTIETLNILTTKLLDPSLKSQENFLYLTLETILQVLDCEAVTYFEIEKGKAYSRMTKIKGGDLVEIINETYEVGEGITGNILTWSNETGYLYGKMQCRNDLSLEGNRADEKLFETYKNLLPSKKISHFLVAPIHGLNAKYVVGIIRVINKVQADPLKVDKNGFDQFDIMVFSHICLLLSHGLREAVQRVNLKNLYNISEKIVKSNSKKELFSYASKAARELFKVEEVSIFEVDEDEQTLVMVVSQTIPQEDFERYWRLQLDAGKEPPGLVVFCANEKKALLFNGDDYKQHPAYRGFTQHYKYLDSKNCYSMMVFPLLDPTENCRGVIRLMNKLGPEERGWFNFEDYYSAKVFASLLASTFRREHYYERQLSLRLALKRMGENNNTDLFKLLQEDIEIIPSLLKADFACFYPCTYENNKPSSLLREHLYFSKGRISKIEINAPRPTGNTEVITRNPQGYEFVNFDEYPEYSTPFLKAEKVNCLLGIRLVASGISFGILYIYYRRSIPEPETEDITMANYLASRVALLYMIFRINEEKDLNTHFIEMNLRQKEQLLRVFDEYILDISHGMRAPATYVKGILENLQKGIPRNFEKQKERIEDARKELEHLLAEAEENFELFKLENDLPTGSPKFRPTDLLILIQSVIEQHSQTAKDKQGNCLARFKSGEI